MLLRLGGEPGNRLRMLRWRRLLLLLLLRLLLTLLAEMSRSFPRVLMEVGRRLGTGAAVGGVMLWGVVVVVVLSGLLDVVMGVPELPVLADQVLHLPLELVDALALRLDQALLVLDDGGELLQVQNGFHWIIQQALHH